MKKSERSLTETEDIQINWQKLETVCKGVIPCVVQDAKTKKVLLLAYVNQEALEATLRTGLATFWSTSRNCLWVKGKESGNFLYVLEIRVNCEQNSLLYLVSLTKGGACHTKNSKGEYRQSCFCRKIEEGELVSEEE